MVTYHAHLNINSIRNKICFLEDISETKIDSSFLNAQFLMKGFSEPIRLDRTAHGSRLLLYTRKDIIRKILSLTVAGIECLIIEITISKKKWLVLGFYNPDKSTIKENINIVEANLFHYLPKYNNILLGDINCDVSETPMKTF